jgi:hypothetical protein
LKIASVGFKTILLIAAAVILNSCSSTTIDEYRQGETGISFDDKIVVLGRRVDPNYLTSHEFINCIREGIENNEVPISVVNQKEFVKNMGGYFSARHAPSSISSFRERMDNPHFETLIEKSGVRYIVWVDGTTIKSDQKANMSCSITPGGGGCFGFMTWEDTSDFQTEVWDVNSRSLVGSISTDANGQSYVPALVVPLPLLARVESNACERLAIQLNNFIRGG